MQRSSQPANQLEQPSNGASDAGSLFSPGFKSVVAMAGWDEEAILIASLVVDDTPERDLKQKKRPEFGLKTPPTYSRRKRRNQRRSSPIEAKILNLDEEETIDEKKLSKFSRTDVNVKQNIQEDSGRCSEASSSNAGIPCMDKLREELSCAICLDICYEPSTTSCGHSFCRKCLRSASDKCGKKCPKCRQLISNGRSCPVNTVLWNTIQLLFPDEIDARKKVTEVSIKSTDSEKRQSPTFRAVRMSTRSPVFHPVRASRSSRTGLNRGVATPSQAEDAALALRLQREEFMEAFRAENDTSLPLATARANLRAMASRAMSLRVTRGRP